MVEMIPESLAESLKSYPRPALAFSGGCKSAFLMYACKELGIDMIPYFVVGDFQTTAELVNVRNLCNRYGFVPRILEFNQLSEENIARNGEDRCYNCKKMMLSIIIYFAKRDGRGCIMDGTCLSAEPGLWMKALEELGIRSPLKDSGLTRADVRELSRESGLTTWDIPSNSCLATRIPTGMPVTHDLLRRTNIAEMELRRMGFKDIRVRTTEDDGALLEVTEKQKGFLDENMAEAEELLLNYYDSVSFGERKSQ